MQMLSYTSALMNHVMLWPQFSWHLWEIVSWCERLDSPKPSSKHQIRESLKKCSSSLQLRSRDLENLWQGALKLLWRLTVAQQFAKTHYITFYILLIWPKWFYGYVAQDEIITLTFWYGKVQEPLLQILTDSFLDEQREVYGTCQQFK